MTAPSPRFGLAETLILAVFRKKLLVLLAIIDRQPIGNLPFPVPVPLPFPAHEPILKALKQHFFQPNPLLLVHALNFKPFGVISDVGAGEAFD